MNQAFLLKYAEIGIKGKNRYKFENALCDDIRRRLARIDGEHTVERGSGRIFVESTGDFDEDEVIEEYLEDYYGENKRKKKSANPYQQKKKKKR